MPKEFKFQTRTGRYALCGEGLCIGYDWGDAVSGEYTPKFPFSDGRIIKVVFDVVVTTEGALLSHAAVMARD